MKLILAVVQDVDSDSAIGELTKSGYQVTRIASTGGFFRSGNSTLLCAAADEHLDKVLGILRKFCRRRTRILPLSIDPSDPVLLTLNEYYEVLGGGAIVLVLNIERFELI